VLPAAENADIAMRAYHATADATFSNYRVNAPQTPQPLASPTATSTPK
jgi:hypothetical protein